MKITKDNLKELSDVVNSPDRAERRKLYYEMYLILNGGLHALLVEAVKKEFKDPGAVMDLIGRLVPINILKKVITKIAGVYTEAPVRSPTNESTDDGELLEDYEDTTKINIRQKQANRYLELFKKNLKEVFSSGKNGKVMLRNLAPHSYEVFNLGNPDKSQPDVVCKIIVDDFDKTKQVFHWFSDQSFWITNGDGVVDQAAMNALENPRGINPSKVLPFVYKCKSTDSVDPVVDESLYRISIAIPIVLTDLFFACKYQCWSIIYTIGVKGEINRNPSSVVALDFTPNASAAQKDPIVGSIDPSVDSDKVIKMVEATLNMFLSSIGLSGGTLSAGTGAKDVVSGVSKILDSAEVIEGKKDQQDDMLDDENMTWAKIVQLIPFWRRNGLLNRGLNREFSRDFQVSVTFKDPKALISETDRLDAGEKKLKLKLTTWTRLLKEAYPDYTDDQIENLKEEILEEMKLYPEIYSPTQAPKDVVPPKDKPIDDVQP